MPVTFHLPKVLIPLAGAAQVQACGSTLKEAVDELAVRFPQLAARLRGPGGEPHQYLLFYVNEEDIRFLEGFDTPLHDADEITVVSAVAGG